MQRTRAARRTGSSAGWSALVYTKGTPAAGKNSASVTLNCAPATTSVAISILLLRPSGAGRQQNLRRIARGDRGDRNRQLAPRGVPRGEPGRGTRTIEPETRRIHTHAYTRALRAGTLRYSRTEAHRTMLRYLSKFRRSSSSSNTGRPFRKQTRTATWREVLLQWPVWAVAHSIMRYLPFGEGHSRRSRFGLSHVIDLFTRRTYHVDTLSPSPSRQPQLFEPPANPPSPSKSGLSHRDGSRKITTFMFHLLITRPAAHIFRLRLPRGLGVRTRRVSS
jgi:hypothetical protein